MYDNYDYCPDYYRYRALTEKILNGETVKFPVRWLMRKIQESYDNGNLQGSQYDHLMGMLQDIDDDDKHKGGKA